MLYEDQKLMEGLLQIGNNEEVKKLCEPRVMQSLKLELWMILRVIVSLEIFLHEWKDVIDGK